MRLSCSKFYVDLYGPEMNNSSPQLLVCFDHDHHLLRALLYAVTLLRRSISLNMCVINFFLQVDTILLLKLQSVGIV